MALSERILEVLRRHEFGLDDDELAACLVAGRQHVNQVCRRLEAQGLLTRVRHTGKLVNHLRDSSARPRPLRHLAVARPSLTQILVSILSKAILRKGCGVATSFYTFVHWSLRMMRLAPSESSCLRAAIGGRKSPRSIPTALAHSVGSRFRARTRSLAFMSFPTRRGPCMWAKPPIYPSASTTGTETSPQSIASWAARQRTARSICASCGG